MIPLLLAIPGGMALFLAFVWPLRGDSGRWAFLPSAGALLRYFLWPWAPYRMLGVEDLDGTQSLWYDDEFSETQVEDGSLIQTVEGDEYLSKTPFGDASLQISPLDARGIPGDPASPYGLAWRWVVGSAVSLFLIYFSLIQAIIVPPVLHHVPHTAYYTIESVQASPWIISLVTTAFSVAFIWLFVNVRRFQDRVISSAWFHVKGIDPPYMTVVPSLGSSRIGTLRYLSELGRDVKVVVSAAVGDAVKQVLREMEKETGSMQLAAVQLSRVAMAFKWRKALGQTLRERYAIIRAEGVRFSQGLAAGAGIASPSRRTWLITLLAAVVAFALGYLLANYVGIGVVPVHNLTAPPNLTRFKVTAP